MMNLTVPTVTGRLRRKSIAAEVAHCMPELRFEDGAGSAAKHHAKRRGSLGGEPIRRPSLVSRWFKHISDAADAYKARTKGTHEYGDDSSGGGAGHPPKDSFETVTETQKIEQTSTPLERKDTQCRAISSSAVVGHHPHQQQQQQNQQSPHHHHQQQHSSNVGHGTGGAAGGGGGTPTHGAGAGGRSAAADEDHHSHGKGRHSTGAGTGPGGANANETEDNLENEEKEKFKRTQRHGSQECNGRSSDDGEDDDDAPEDDEHYPRRGAASGGRGPNNTRTITQQCSLVAPSEIHVSVSATLTAEPILTPAEQMRRYDQLIQKTLASKQRIVCDMFKVPDEHFQAIADIAAQPEAPKEPTDIVLAAFAYGQTLMEILNEHTQVTDSQQISAVSTSICDECSVRRGRCTTGSSSNSSSNSNSRNIPSTTTTGAKDPIEPTGPTIGGQSVPSASNNTSPPSAPQVAGQPPPPPPPIAVAVLDQSVNITEDEDGYCEIDEVRAAAVLMAENEKARKLTEASKLAAAAAAATAVDTLDDGVIGGVPKSPESHIEINENYDSTVSPSMTQKYSGPMGVELCGKNRLLHATSLAPTVPCHLIASYVTGLNAQISQLLHKISEKDVEREHLRRENQHLRELLNAMHQERVLESQETNQEQQPTNGDDQQTQLPVTSSSTVTAGSDGSTNQQQQQQQTAVTAPVAPSSPSPTVEDVGNAAGGGTTAAPPTNATD